MLSRFRYYKGRRGSTETLEADVLSGNTYITTCAISVQLLICGIKTFPCGNGDTVELSRAQQLDALLFLQKERKKLTEGMAVKSYQGWQDCGLPSFDDYCKPGDTVDEEMVDYFMNAVPPVSMRSDCAQAGEAFSHEADENDQYRPTYTTFVRLTASSWRFEGYCFKGSTDNRAQVKTSLTRRIEAVKREVQA